jgi:hypothetical protein
MENTNMKSSFNTHSCLKSLESDFAAFRSQRRRHERFPEHLRRAVLDAIASGLEPSLVTKTLKVTKSQLAQWQRHLLLPTAVEESPRILQVIPSIPDAAIPTGLRVTYEAGRLLLELSF